MWANELVKQQSTNQNKETQKQKRCAYSSTTQLYGGAGRTQSPMNYTAETHKVLKSSQGYPTQTSPIKSESASD